MTRTGTDAAPFFLYVFDLLELNGDTFAASPVTGGAMRSLG
jgi:hypothetical protein